MKILALWTKLNQILFGEWFEVGEGGGFWEQIRDASKWPPKTGVAASL